MIHINKFKIFEEKRSVESICDQWDIKHYSINQDGSVDVNGSEMNSQLSLVMFLDHSIVLGID